jgi:2-dehydropantoate 2-reductase
VTAEFSDDIRRTLWEKYTFLVGLSATTTTMRTTIGPIRANPRTRAFLYELFKEVVAVGRAHGVNLPADYADDRLKFADSVPATMTSSMHHDLERGNPLEVEWLSGGVVTLGAAVGVPTPANRAIWDILALYAEGRPAAQ